MKTEFAVLGGDVQGVLRTLAEACGDVRARVASSPADTDADLVLLAHEVRRRATHTPTTTTIDLGSCLPSLALSWSTPLSPARTTTQPNQTNRKRPTPSLRSRRCRRARAPRRQ